MKIGLRVKGINKLWHFDVEGTNTNLQAWQDDGVDACEIVGEVDVMLEEMKQVFGWLENGGSLN